MEGNKIEQVIGGVDVTSLKPILVDVILDVLEMHKFLPTNKG